MKKNISDRRLYILHTNSSYKSRPPNLQISHNISFRLEPHFIMQIKKPPIIFLNFWMSLSSSIDNWQDVIGTNAIFYCLKCIDRSNPAGQPALNNFFPKSSWCVDREVYTSFLITLHHLIWPEIKSFPTHRDPRNQKKVWQASIHSWRLIESVA